MEYDYAYFENKEPVHFIRVPRKDTEEARDFPFQNMIKQENGEGHIVVVNKEDNGSYIVYSIFRTGINDKAMDALPWEKRVWNP